MFDWFLRQLLFDPSVFLIFVLSVSKKIPCRNISSKATLFTISLYVQDKLRSKDKVTIQRSILAQMLIRIATLTFRVTLTFRSLFLHESVE